MLPGLSVSTGLMAGTPPAPKVVGTNTSFINSNSGNRTVALPADIAAGDMLVIALAAHRADGLYSAPSGWAEVVQGSVGTTGDGIRVAVFSRIADGSEGSTVVVPTSSWNSRDSHLSWLIEGAASIEAAITTGSAGMPNPPSITPTWGEQPALFLAVGGSSMPRTVSAYPSGYTNGITETTTQSGVSATADVRCSGAERTLETATEDPGAFTLNTNTDRWAAVTLAISALPPSSAGFINASGGTITTDGDYRIHTFSDASDYLVVLSGSGDVEYLIVGGGGGGGGSTGDGYAGGGGGGGEVNVGTTNIGPGSYPILRGNGGGGGGSNVNGSDGGVSSAFGVTSLGGGGGARGSTGSGVAGQPGGSGGGGAGNSAASGGASLATTGIGNPGGNKLGGGVGAAGGGGAGSSGSSNSTNTGGSGGPAYSVSITGSSLGYGAGGTGGTINGSTGSNGANGRGNGGNGGGSPGSGQSGGNGGTGVVIARYRYQ